MKNLTKAAFTLCAALTMMGCGAKGTHAEKIGIEMAEYDGAYVLTKADRFLPMETAETATTRIVYARNGRVSTSQMLGAKDRLYTLSNATNASLDSSLYKGVFIKGNYKFPLYSLHPLEERTLAKGGNELFFEKKGAVGYDVPFYMPGKQIDVLKRSADEENGYYFEVKEPLESGKYVAWIGRNFWVFEITGLDAEPAPLTETE